MNKEQQIINVIFDAGRGVCSVQSREATCGETFGILPTPERAGYSFEGWYLGDVCIDADATVESESDLTLVARWSKRAGTKRASNLKKQRIAIVCCAVLIVLLALALIFVNDLVSVSTVEDRYYDEAGNALTKTYYVKEVKGTWGMYDEDGVKMAVNSDGYHIALSGNQYDIDEETGKCTLYALVDSFDAASGELLGHGARVMMYPQISQSDIYSIRVKNKNEVFEVLRHANGTAYLKGTENRLNVLSDQAFANLSVACGYTLTVEKLDLSATEAPRLPDGSVNYAAYGLSDADEPIVFTITKRAYNEKGETVAATGDHASYTVRVGNVTLTGSGYYAKLEGREAVYILSPTVAPTLVKSSEAMVSPTVLYPMSSTDYLMVKDFLLESGSISLENAYHFANGGEFLSPDKTHVVDFSYQDLLEREHSMYSMHPFTTKTDFMKGYFLDSSYVSDAMHALGRLNNTVCVKHGITEDAIREYIFGGKDRAEVYHLTYRYNVVKRSAVLIRMSDESEAEFHARYLEEAKAALREYTNADVSKLTMKEAQQAMESMGYYLEGDMLFDKAAQLHEIYNFCRGMLIDLGQTADPLPESIALNVSELSKKVDSIVKKLEATDAGFRYDRDTYEIYVVNEIMISQKTEDGVYYVAVPLYDMIVEVGAQHFDFLKWEKDDWYSQYFSWLEIAYMTDLEIIAGDRFYKFRLDNSESTSNLTDGSGSDKLKIYANTGDGERLIDYKILHSYVSDTGKEMTKTVTSLENFREYYQILQYISLESVMDEEELAKLAATDFNGDGAADGLDPDSIRYLDDQYCDLILYFRGVDLRGNSVAKVCRFYTYSGHSFMTMEVVGAYGSDGNPTTDWQSQNDPEAELGLFYVNSSYLQKLLANTDRFLSEELIVLGDKS